jgi:hypothetical protein
LVLHVHMQVECNFHSEGVSYCVRSPLALWTQETLANFQDLLPSKVDGS